MILVKDRDNCVSLFKTTQEAENYLEWIDVMDGEYEACDDEGFLYRFEETAPDSAFSAGRFCMLKSSEADPSKPVSFFVAQGRVLGASPEELDKILSTSRSTSDAVATLKAKRR